MISWGLKIMFPQAAETPRTLNVTYGLDSRED
jgi:hypothetical protein